MPTHSIRISLCALALLGCAILGLQAQNAEARVVIVVPTDAVISVDDTVMRSSGTRRTFNSPALTPGRKFTYTLKATWTENGQPKRAERTIEVEAGKETVVDLTTPASAATSGTAARPPVNPNAKSREFMFTYKAIATGLPPGKIARIWLPVPPTNEDQQAALVTQESAGVGRIGREPKYGNQIYYVEAPAGKDGNATVTLTYRVKRFEVKGDANSRPTPEEMALFLKPDAFVPVGGKTLALIEGRQMPSDQFEFGRVLYDIVNDHMTYSKDKGPGWGRGDAEWACDSRFGNCTDFHSLFISVARAKKIPAKFEMGFSIPVKRGTGEVAGYHCWARFKPEGRGWIPVDISDANKVKTTNPEMVKYLFGNLTEDRVTFSVGRDLTLVPPQAGTPLNFLVYPYVEVDGQPYNGDKVKRAFSYQDVESK